jgi:hypothetical protein
MSTDELKALLGQQLQELADAKARNDYLAVANAASAVARTAMELDLNDGSWQPPVEDFEEQ